MKAFLEKVGQLWNVMPRELASQEASATVNVTRPRKGLTQSSPRISVVNSDRNFTINFSNS